MCGLYYPRGSVFLISVIEYLTNLFSDVWLVFSVKCQSREFLNTILLELPLCTHLYATNEGDVITGCLALLLTTDTVHFTLVVKRLILNGTVHTLFIQI